MRRRRATPRRAQSSTAPISAAAGTRESPGPCRRSSAGLESIASRRTAERPGLTGHTSPRTRTSSGRDRDAAQIALRSDAPTTATERAASSGASSPKPRFTARAHGCQSSLVDQARPTCPPRSRAQRRTVARSRHRRDGRSSRISDSRQPTNATRSAGATQRPISVGTSATSGACVPSAGVTPASRRTASPSSTTGRAGRSQANVRHSGQTGRARARRHPPQRAAIERPAACDPAAVSP